MLVRAVAVEQRDVDTPCPYMVTLRMPVTWFNRFPVTAMLCVGSPNKYRYGCAMHDGRVRRGTVDILLLDIRGPHIKWRRSFDRNGSIPSVICEPVAVR